MQNTNQQSQRAAQASSEERFRLLLQNTLVERIRKNPRYSLRAFAKSLEMNQGTLSQILNGTRKLTLQTRQKIAERLGLVEERFDFGRSVDVDQTEYRQIAVDQLNMISNWHHDALLELLKIKHLSNQPRKMAQSLGISVVEVNAALDRLERLGLIEKKAGRWISHAQDSTLANLGAAESTHAQKSLQKQLLEKALVAIDDVPKAQRNNSSLTVAIDQKDLPKAQALIKEFRRNLNRLLKKENEADIDAVYQLAIAFYPLTKALGEGSDT